MGCTDYEHQPTRKKANTNNACIPDFNSHHVTAWAYCSSNVFTSVMVAALSRSDSVVALNVRGNNE